MQPPTLKDLPAPPRGRNGWPWTEASPPLPDMMPNGRPWPRISVVTPSRNQAAFIEETIRSVLLQGYPDVEYVVMDGASTDSSVELIRKYAPWLHTWRSEPDNGQSHAINKGLAAATGGIFAWLNSDDFYMPGAFGTVAEQFSALPETVGAIVGRGQKVDATYKVVYDRTPSALTFEALLDWLDVTHFMQPSCFFRRSAWQACGPLDEDLHIALDLDLWLRIAKASRLAPVPALLSRAHAHAAAKTQRLRSRMLAETAYVLAKHGESGRTLRILRQLAKRIEDLEGELDRLRSHPAARMLAAAMKAVGYTPWRKGAGKTP